MAAFNLPSTSLARRAVQGVVAAGRVFVPAANLAATDTIEICKLPANARVLDIIVGHTSAATMTIDVGDGTDVDKYLDGVVIASAAVGRLNEGVTGLMDFNTAEVTVTLTVNAITTPNTTGEVNAVVLYSQDVEVT
ncbi:MAG: hypothetical protein ACR2QH_15315 [Geminicoccaceae bacterium]